MKDDTAQNSENRDTFLYTEKKVQRLCEVDLYLIYQATKLAGDQNRKLCLKRWLNELSLQEKQPYHIPDGVPYLRKPFVNAYLVRRRIPLEDIYNEVLLNVNRSRRVNKFSSLKMNNYTLCRLPKTRKGILTEKSEMLNERILYLKKITQYRDEGRKIIYMEERITFDRAITEDNYEFESVCNHCIMLLNEEGIVLNFSIICGNVQVRVAKFLYDFIEKNLDRLPPNSVIVLKDKAHHKQNVMPMPTQFSSKKQMTDWLQYNEIQHDSEWHRAELYKLIEINMGNCKVEYNIDYFLKSHGHDVLRCPRHCQFLNHFHDFWGAVNRLLHKKHLRLTLAYSIKESFDEAGKVFTPNIWKEKEKALIFLENKTLKEDLQVEETIDRLCTMMKYGDSDKNHGEITDLDYPLMEKDYNFSKVVASSLDETGHYLLRPC